MHGDMTPATRQQQAELQQQQQTCIGLLVAANMGEAQLAHLPLDVQCRRLLLAHGLAEPHQVTPGASSHSDGAPDLHGGGSHQAQLGRGVRQALLSVGGQQASWAPLHVFQLCHQALKGLYGLLQALAGPPLFLQNSGAQAQRDGIALRKMPKQRLRRKLPRHCHQLMREFLPALPHLKSHQATPNSRKVSRKCCIRQTGPAAPTHRHGAGTDAPRPLQIDICAAIALGIQVCTTTPGPVISNCRNVEVARKGSLHSGGR